MRKHLQHIFGPLTQPDVRWFIPGFILLTAALSLFILHIDINSYKQYAENVPMHREVDALNTLHAEKMNAIFNGEFIENFNFTFRGINTFIFPPPISIFDLTSSYGAITPHPFVIKNSSPFPFSGKCFTKLPVSGVITI
ncbi:MAG: hypothetical protein NT166_32410 [Candidatus Aminicenantes bacterium]|nr:hypothetical protein [Candidatus Aminicenantes bacterium]